MDTKAQTNFDIIKQMTLEDYLLDYERPCREIEEKKLCMYYITCYECRKQWLQIKVM